MATPPRGPAAAPHPALVLFLVSLLVRLAFLVPVIATSMPPLLDEGPYYSRAVAIAHVIASWATGRAPDRLDLIAAYGAGVWPPLHSIVLAIPMAVLGASVAVARATVVLLSALTTPVLYALGARVSSRR